MATINDILSNKDLAMELFSKETPEAVQAYLKEKGVEMSIEDIKKMGADLEKEVNGELSEDDLENVAGGIFDAWHGYQCSLIRTQTITSSEWDAVKRWLKRW